jgi:hypothetical protein
MADPLIPVSLESGGKATDAVSTISIVLAVFTQIEYLRHLPLLLILI